MKMTHVRRSGVTARRKLDESESESETEDDQLVRNNNISAIHIASTSIHRGHVLYRPDIDGLRAVAVTFVVVFHFVPARQLATFGFSGGFVGVDVFFVISGYLISGVVFRRVEAGSFTYSDFYSRRIRRIFPTLAVVLLFNLVAGILWLRPVQLRKMGETMAWGAAFSANIGLAFSVNREANRIKARVESAQADAIVTGADDGATNTPWLHSQSNDGNNHHGYFGDVQSGTSHGQANPLLHLWSLGVEEQFYIFWPLVVPWIVTLTKQQRCRGAAMLLIMFAISFGLNLAIGYAVEGDDSSFGYYFPVSRFWEIAMGALVSWVPQQLSASEQSWLAKRSREVSWLREAASVCGLALIIASPFYVAKDVVFPGWIACVPTVGAALVIGAGSDCFSSPRGTCSLPSVNKWVLGNPALTFVGKISYPIYMWHWSVYVFLIDVLPDVYNSEHHSVAADGLLLDIRCSSDGRGWQWSSGCDHCVKIAVAALVVVLSVITMYAVENPLRYLKWRWTPIVLAVGVCILGISGLLLSSGVVKGRAATSCIFDACPNAPWPFEYQIVQNLTTTYRGRGSLRVLHPECPQAPPFYDPPAFLPNTIPQRILHRNGVCKDAITFASLDQHNPIPQGGPTMTIGGAVKNDTVVYVFGDSHANQWRYRYQYLAAHHRNVMPRVEINAMWAYLPLFEGQGPSGSPARLHWPYHYRWPSFKLEAIKASLADPSIKNVTVVLDGYFEYFLKRMWKGPCNSAGVCEEDGDNVAHWPRTQALVDAGHRAWPDDTLAILRDWTSQIREWTAMGARVFLVGNYPYYWSAWSKGIDEGQSVACPDYNHTGNVDLGTEYGPRMMKNAAKQRTVPDLEPYLRPHNVTEWNTRIGFISDPLVRAAAIAGAVVLDPTSTLCLEGRCPLVDPAGWPTFLDNHHLSPTFVEVYASFLDVTVGLQGVARQPKEYCV
eukprot:SAG31_NODE_3416_length_4302_cov_5.168451_1_plen_947_part_00